MRIITQILKFWTEYGELLRTASSATETWTPRAPQTELQDTSQGAAQAWRYPPKLMQTTDTVAEAPISFN